MKKCIVFLHRAPLLVYISDFSKRIGVFNCKIGMFVMVFVAYERENFKFKMALSY